MASQPVSKHVVCGLLFLFLTTISSWLSACAGPTETGAAIEAFFADFDGVSQPPEGKYLFVETWVDYEGPGGLIDRPTYRFNPTSKILETGYRKDNFPMKEDDWGLIGEGQSIQVTGGGIASHLIGINSLPITMTIQVFTGNTITYLAGQPNEYLVEEMIEFPVIILFASAEGTLVVEIDGRPIVLAADERWSHVVETDVVRDGHKTHFRIESSLTNYGWLDRTLIDPRP